jgi:hypothetical protein
MFYLVFFPIVFIIIFIYMLSNKLFGHHKGLRILIAVAVFAFIILQGWYYFFMNLGELWYIGLIILGFFWLILYGLRGGIGGGGAQSRAGDGSESKGGIAHKLVKRLKHQVTGDVNRVEREIDTTLHEIEAIKKSAASGNEGAWRMAAAVLERLHTLRREYLEFLRGPGGFRLGGRYKQYEAKINRAIKDLQGIQSKSRSS